MNLTTSRLLLRPWREPDLIPFARLNDPAITEFLPRRLSRDESDSMAARIRTDMEKRSWRLAREHWGFGYASEAAAASLRFAFEKLTFQQIVAFTVPLNRRSIREMERIGMSRDLAGNFEHPRLPPDHPLRPHVLYRINRGDLYVPRDAQLT